MPDTTLKVVVDLRGQGDVAALLRRQQQQVESLARAETHNVAVREQAVAVQRQNFAATAAMVAAQAVATRSAVSGLGEQIRSTRELTGVQREARGEQLKDAATALLPPAGATRAHRKQNRDELVKQLAEEQKGFEDARAAFGRRASELTPGREGKNLRGQLEKTYRAQFEARPGRQLIGVQNDRIRAAAETKLFDKSEGYKERNTYAEDQLAVMRETVLLSRDQAGLDVRRADLAAQIVGSQEFAAAAYQRSRAASAESLNDTRAAAVAARERATYLATPKGRQELQAQAGLMRDMVASQRSARWSELIAQQGRFGGALTYASERLKDFRASLDGIGSTAGWVFAAGTAGIASFVAAASPVHFQTLARSFEMLAATIGREFLPYADDLSRWLQRTARWIDGLDDGTKSWAARLAVAGIAVAAFATIVPRAVAAVQALTLAMANPLTAGILAVGALTVGVLALSGAFSSAGINAQALGSKIARMEADTRRIQAGGFRDKDVLKLPQEVRDEIEVRRARGEDTKKFAAGMAGQIEQEAKALDASMPEKLKKLEAAAADINKVNPQFWGTRFGAASEGTVARMFGLDPRRQADALGDLLRGARDEAGKLDPERLAELLRRPQVEKREQVAVLQQLAGAKPGAAGGADKDDLMRSYRGLLPQPAYVGIGQLQERLQLAALNPEGDLDRKLQEDQNRILAEVLVAINEVRDNTRPIKWQVPAVK